MATLPAHHPNLAVHLSDRALTSIISSSNPHPEPTTPSQQQQQQTSSSSRKQSQPTFSTSPLSSSTASSTPSSPAHPSAAPLASLTTTALTSYATAKRLGRGAPLRTIIEYPNAGPVVLHSYLCPTSLGIIPGARERATAATGEEAQQQPPQPSMLRGADIAIAGHSDHDAAEVLDDRERGVGNGNRDGDGDDPDGGTNAPPLLIATVVAPSSTRDLKEARGAARRLERIARSLQMEWVAAGPGTGV